LGVIAAAAVRAGLRSPAVVVIGGVVDIRTAADRPIAIDWPADCAVD